MDKNKKWILIVFLVMMVATLGTGIALAGPPGPKNAPDGHSLVTICHKSGTPAEKTMDVPDSAVPGHLGHGDTLGSCSPPPPPTPTPVPPTPTPVPPPPTGCGAPGIIDICVDGDGIATAGPGAFIIQIGDVILSASAGGNPSGLDLIDRGIINGQYDAGDDLMVEDPIATGKFFLNSQLVIWSTSLPHRSKAINLRACPGRF